MYTDSPGAPELSAEESNTLKIVALWAKVTGQSGFKTEDGTFRERDNYAIGRLNLEEKNLEIIVQQNPNKGARTISVSKLSEGFPLVTCTIPADGNENGKIIVSGAIDDAGKFYDGVISLLDDKQIGADEVARLSQDKADTILTTLV